MPSPPSSLLLPPRFSTDVLERNLAALHEVNPALGERLLLPVNGDRVQFDEEGRTWRVVHNSRIPLELEPATFEDKMAALASAARVLILGVGLGEAIDDVLARSSVEEVIAWDRDPWLLRLYLMRRDRHREIREGRLRFALCADLLDLDPTGYARFEHPLLAELYRGEIDFLDRAPGSSRAILCAGSLFVKQLADAMRKRGWDLWELEVRELAEEELAHCIERFHPEFAVTINYTEGLAEFCARYGMKLMCWEVDPALRPPLPHDEPLDHTFVFTHRKANVPLYHAAGFPHVEYMPLAADPSVRFRHDVPQAERGCPLSFVGASMVQTARSFRGQFVEAYVRWKSGTPGAEAEGMRILSETVAVQRAHPATFMLPELLEAQAPGFAKIVDQDAEIADPVVLLGELSASEKRLSYVANLGAMGIQVWGDAGWRIVVPHGARYMGHAAHQYQLTEIYNDTQVNIDIGRIYQNDIVTMRVYDIISCGAFLIAEHNEALEEVLEVGVEVESYRTLDELKAKIRYYLEHPAAAEEIARRGQEAVHRHHTIAQRFDYMLEVISAA